MNLQPTRLLFLNIPLSRLIITMILCLFGLTGMGQVKNDTVIVVSNTKIEIHYTDLPVNGVILVLPGWNFPQDDICLKSDFCSRAKQAGYILVMPDMKKSVYQQQIYPETRVDWLKYHTLGWLRDTVFPLLRHDYGLLNPGQVNFLYGISTGARGVAMLALNAKNIFIAGAALSGDYNQELMAEDNLMKGYYGAFQAFPMRWKGDDNPWENSTKMTIPLFLAHGLQDKVVPCNQTETFFNRLKSVNPHLPHELVMMEGAGHDYAFWSSMTGPVFEFFDARKNEFLNFSLKPTGRNSH